jgi:hypothetical protein
MDIKASFISYICNQITNIEVKMVLEIRLSNMFSFRDEVTLDLQAAKIQTKKARELEGNLFSVDGEQMLKSVALFGANASGKSNVIKAIRACVNMVRSSHNYNVTPSLPSHLSSLRIMPTSQALSTSVSC